MMRIFFAKTLDIFDDFVDLEQTIPVTFGRSQGTIINKGPHVVNHLILGHKQPFLSVDVPIHALSELFLAHRTHEAACVVIQKEEHIRRVNDKRGEDNVRNREQVKDHVLKSFLLLVLLADTLTGGIVNLIVLVGLLVVL